MFQYLFRLTLCHQANSLFDPYLKKIRKHFWASPWRSTSVTALYSRVLIWIMEGGLHFLYVSHSFKNTTGIVSKISMAGSTIQKSHTNPVYLYVVHSVSSNITHIRSSSLKLALDDSESTVFWNTCCNEMYL